jgi:radical SAM protein with 4Fe4S-binding SPASM domain
VVTAAGDGPVLNRGVPMAELSADDAIAELARIARDLAQTSGVSYREAFETLRDSLLLIRKARADGAAEERERWESGVCSICRTPYCGGGCEQDEMRAAADPDPDWP